MSEKETNGLPDAPTPEATVPSEGRPLFVNAPRPGMRPGRVRH